MCRRMMNVRSNSRLPTGGGCQMVDSLRWTIRCRRLNDGGANGPAPERRSTATSRHARRRWRRSPRVGDGNRLALPFGVAALEPTEMPTWLGYIPLVIFALLMLTIIARGF